MNERPEIKYMGEDRVPVKFSGCDVCYTCAYFREDFKCYWPMREEDRYEFMHCNVSGDKIKNSAWNRCGFWKSKDDYEKRRKKT